MVIQDTLHANQVFTMPSHIRLPGVCRSFRGQLCDVLFSFGGEKVGVGVQRDADTWVSCAVPRHPRHCSCGDC